MKITSTPTLSEPEYPRLWKGPYYYYIQYSKTLAVCLNTGIFYRCFVESSDLEPVESITIAL